MFLELWSGPSLFAQLPAPDPVWKSGVPATPHRCPVCEGKGVVPAGFYSPGVQTGSTNPEPCRAGCENGVLWR